MRALTQARTRTRGAGQPAVRSRRPLIAAQEHIMSINHRQQHQLYQIESGLLRSDPQLGAMLAAFAKLSAGQRMPTWEQVATRQDRIHQATALTLQTIAVI